MRGGQKDDPVVAAQQALLRAFPVAFTVTTTSGDAKTGSGQWMPPGNAAGRLI